MLTRSVAMHHVRAALRGAQNKGVDLAPILERAGIPADLLEVDRARVTTEQFASLVEELWLTLDDELVGLGSGPTKLGTFAMMCHAAMHGSRDLRAALNRGAEFYALFPDGPRVRLVENPADGEARIEFDIAGHDDPQRFGAETLVVLAHRFAGWLISRRIRLRRVEFSYPPPGHVAEHDLIFGAPCVFDTPTTALVFDRALLDYPVAHDEAGLASFLQRAPEDVLARIDYGSTTTTRVRRLIGQALPGAPPAAEDVAARLSMSPQTLRRRLADEGTTFQQVRDEMRRDHAIAVLADGQTPIETLSRQLGFSDPSAFHRSFRRWTGSTPRAYQASGGAPDQPTSSR